MDDRTWRVIIAVVILSAFAQFLDWQNPDFKVGTQFWLFLAAVIGLLGIYGRGGGGGGRNGGNGGRRRQEDDDDA